MHNNSQGSKEPCCECRYQISLWALEISISFTLQATVELLKENGSVSSDYVTPPPIPLTRQEVDEV